MVRVRRDTKPVDVTMTTTASKDDPDAAVVGIGITIDYDLPFEVTINLGGGIGGPSAGTVFALAIYDKLTPESLTGGHSIAGTGSITPDGTIEPIGGIQQKIVGAESEGASVFLVPTVNCEEAAGADVTRRQHPAGRGDRARGRRRRTDRPRRGPRRGRADVRVSESGLRRATLEIDATLTGSGWDQPPRLYALVHTTRLLEQEPSLASSLGLSDESGDFTAVEQEPLTAEQSFEEVLAEIEWPPEVDGCAAAVERLVLPPSAEEALPDDSEQLRAYAAQHPRAPGGTDRGRRAARRPGALRAAGARPRRAAGPGRGTGPRPRPGTAAGRHARRRVTGPSVDDGGGA